MWGFFYSKCKVRLLFICRSKHWFQSAIRIMSPARMKVRCLSLRRADPAGSHQSTLTGSAERMEKNKCFPSCSFHKNKDWCSSGVCFKLKNVYLFQHSQPKTYTIPGITKTMSGKGLRINKIESEFNLMLSLTFDRDCEDVKNSLRAIVWQDFIAKVWMMTN